MKRHNLSTMSEQELFEAIKSSENVQNTLLLENMISTDTFYGPMTLELIKAGKPETRSFVTFLARQIVPLTFLEVGVRRGWSTAAVAMASPDCQIYAFDEWHENYGGAPNPGPQFVQSELSKLGYNKPIVFISGDSHKTLPKFFKENDETFDMILIDGDHSVEGAWQDLMDTMPHINVGGVMVFDDIIDCDGLQDVWNNLVNHFPNFKYFSYRGNKPGVACAVRIS